MNNDDLKHDMLGRAIKRGDILAFATRHSCTAEMKFAKVLDWAVTKDGWNPGTPRLKIRSVERRYNNEWRLTTRAGFLDSNSRFLILDYVPTDLQTIFDSIL